MKIKFETDDSLDDIDHSFHTPVTIHFQDTHKQVYVSRYYYKSLKERIKEMR